MCFKRELISLIYLIYFSNLCLLSQSYSVEIEKLVLNPASDPTWFTDYTLRTTKIGKNTFAVSGGFELLKNVGNDIQPTLAIYRKNKVTGNYFPSPIYTTTSAPCKLYEENAFVDGLIAASNFPPKGTCPLPKAHYNISNYTVTSEDLPDFIPEGEYKIVLSVMKEQKLIAAIELLVNVLK